MDKFKEQYDSMWEEIEKPSELIKNPSDDEKWKQFVEEYKGSNYIVFSEWGTIDFGEPHDIRKGENITYDEYLNIQKISSSNCKKALQEIYFMNYEADYHGQITDINSKYVIFERIFITGWYLDGTSYKDKEDHIWIEKKYFTGFEVGDNISFHAEVYQYIKTKNGKQIDYSLDKPYDIEKIEEYKLPTEEELVMQEIDKMICDVCLFSKHCYGTYCLASEEWRESMRAELFAHYKSN